MPLRSLTESEHQRQNAILQMEFDEVWTRLESQPGGQLLLEALCRTEISVEPSLLLFVSDHVATPEEAKAWVYLLCFRRKCQTQVVTWASFRNQLPDPDLWPEEKAVQECGSHNLDDAGVWAALTK